MKKTLAEFKRDIYTGMLIQCTRIDEAKVSPSWEGGNYDTAYYENLQEVPLVAKMTPVRTLTYKDTTGFYLNATPEDGKRGSYCQYPLASDFYYDGETFTIIVRAKNGQAIQKRYYAIRST